MNPIGGSAMKRISRSTKKGMSLVEIIVVVVIMVIILAAVIGVLAYNLSQAEDFLGGL